MRRHLCFVWRWAGLAVVWAAFLSAAAAARVADFSYLGSPPSKWEMGPNAATEHSFVAPDGPRRPGSATFSIVPSGLRSAGDADAAHGGNLTRDITALGVPEFASVDDYAAVVDWALDQWDAASGFTNLGRVADSGAAMGAADSLGGHLGDVRVAAWELASASLVAHTFQPGNEAVYGAGGTVAGDLHFDVSRIWIDDPLAGDSSTRFDIYTVMLHEIGHALGLGHSTVRGAVMENSYRGANRALTAADVAGIQAIYGVPEPASGMLAVLAAIVLLRQRSRRARRW